MVGPGGLGEAIRGETGNGLRQRPGPGKSPPTVKTLRQDDDWAPLLGSIVDHLLGTGEIIVHFPALYQQLPHREGKVESARVAHLVPPVVL